MLEYCVFVLTVIAFVGLIFAVVVYCIHKVENRKEAITPEILKVNNSNCPPLRSYTVCSSVEIRKVYDFEKRKFTGELEECAFFRSYAVPVELRTICSCSTELFIAYPVGSCPWHVGDLLEMEGHYVENLIRSVGDVRVAQNNTETGEKVVTLSDDWYVRVMDRRERHKVQS